MKISKGFILRSVAGNNIVVPIGENAKKFNGVIKLNESGVFMWKKLEQGIELDELVLALTNEYDVDEQTARRDVEAFTQALITAKIAE